MSYFRWTTFALLGTIALACFAQAPAKKGNSGVTKKDYGKTSDGQAVELYTLTNANGMKAEIITRGGTLVSLTAPDKSGKYGDVILGMDDIKGYETPVPYFGALIGRYGNRIGKAQFALDGKTYKLPANDGPNTLHGGIKGFDKRVWAAKPGSGAELELTYVSKDGEEGFPGTLSTKVVYSMTDKNELKIDYTATTDKATVVNLTNHSYFNLACEGAILNHELMIDASRFTPVDAGLIPTGELRSVKGTPMDFTQATLIGARIDQQDEQLTAGRGYDHNWVLNNGSGRLALAARVYEPGSGRVMEVYTTEPGMQFYSGNFLDGSITGKGGQVYKQRYGLCLETQHFPDSPNKPGFPSTVLNPGQRYNSSTIYRFSVR